MPTPAGAFSVELLRKQHDRGGFDCGSGALNEYLRTQARQDIDRGSAVVYVLVFEPAPDQVAGFYTLSSTSVKLADWPDEVRRKLPRYPLVPSTLIGRLAVGLAYRGHGLGEHLLIDALTRSLTASKDVGSSAVIVDAKNAGAIAFYERYGFMSFPEHPQRLCLPMKTVAQLKK